MNGLDDGGRVNRERGRNNFRREANRLRMQNARAIQRAAREERERAEAALERREEYERTLYTIFKDQTVSDLSEIPRIASVIILAVIIGENSVLGDTCALHAANAMFKDIRQIIDNGHVWNDQLGESFQNHHDQR